jgi:hypothetical protein
MAMRARFQDQKVCVIIERVYLVIQLASVAGSSIIYSLVILQENRAGRIILLFDEN